MLKSVAAFICGSILIHGWQGSPSFNEQSVYFPLQLSQGQEQVRTTAMLDTGAYELVIPERIAKELGLKIDSTSQSVGIGGAESVSESLVNIELGNHIYDNLPCEISPNTDVVWFSMGTLRMLGAASVSINLQTNEIKITGS